MPIPGYVAKSWEIFECLNETEIESLNEGREKWLNRILSMNDVDLHNGTKARIKLTGILTQGNCPISLAALNELLGKKSGAPPI